MKRTVFFLSDHTGLTAEAMGRALLSQFCGLEFDTVHWPFLDSREKVDNAVRKIDQAAATDAVRPLVFSSFVNPESRQQLRQSGGLVLDFFDAYTSVLEEELRMQASCVPGVFHGQGRRDAYKARMRAVHFAMENDDGTVTGNYPAAEVILVGVSRVGKTPTCIYLGLQFGILAANYPITDEDLERDDSAPIFLKYATKLFGLTIDPVQLHHIRSERRAGGRYARIDQCRREVRATEALFRYYRIPYIDTTSMSVEEIAASIVLHTGLEKR